MSIARVIGRGWAAMLYVGTAMAAESLTCEVNVNVMMTDAGRKLAPASSKHPVAYLPLVGGFRQEGAPGANDAQPQRDRVLPLFQKVLSERGYLAVSAQANPPPPLVLAIFWGTFTPEADIDPTDSEALGTGFNQKDMLGLVGGQMLEGMRLPREQNAIYENALDERFFAIVTAYDYAAARQKKRVVLWQARMSTLAKGVTLDNVLPSLIAAGGPLLGRETSRPKWVDMPVFPQGTVEIGPTTVKEYLDAPKQNPMVQKK